MQFSISVRRLLGGGGGGASSSMCVLDNERCADLLSTGCRAH